MKRKKHTNTIRICNILFCFILFSLIIVRILFGPGREEKIIALNELAVPNINGTTENPVPYESVPIEKKEKHLLVPTICQYPALPTGCESVAATMVLQYYGVDVSAEDFARYWLHSSMNFYTKEGKLYGPDPNKVFAGDPFHKNSYGCFADPIVSAINRNCKSCTAVKITGKSLKQLCTDYIDRSEPILIWATMGMKSAKEGNSWYLEDGSVFTWIAGEHCLVLVGYDESRYFLNDPMTGATVAYQKEIVEARFAQLGSQAVYISKNK